MGRFEYVASSSTYDYMLDKASEFYSEGNYSDALVLYLEIMNTGVDDSIYYQTALCYNKLNNLDKAVEYLEKSLALNDRRLSAFVMLAEIYSKLGDNKKAIYNYLRARTIKPDHSASILELAKLFALENKEFESVYFYNKFIQFAKDKKSREYRQISSDINNRRTTASRNFSSGIREFNKGNLFASKNEFVRANELYPIDYETNYNLARVCNDSGDFNTSLRYFQRALFLDDTDKKIYMYLASVYSKIRDYSRAYCFTKKYLDFVVKENNQAEYLKTIKTLKAFEPYKMAGNVSVNIAENYFNNNRYIEAKLEYDCVLILQPELESELKSKINMLNLVIHPEKVLAELYIEKGKSLYNLGKIKEAESFFTRVMEITSANTQEYKLAKSRVGNV